MDVAKVDRRMFVHVVYVSIVLKACRNSTFFKCFRCFSGVFRLCFSNTSFSCVYLDVVYVGHICCMCFIWMFAYSYNNIYCTSIGLLPIIRHENGLDMDGYH